MTINERFKHIRKTLKLTQTEFGISLSLKQNTITQIEKGKSIVTDRTILLLCKTYNVNEEWLRNGGNDDEMFREVSDEFIKDLAQEYDLDKDNQAFLLAYAKMEKGKRQQLHALIKELIISVMKEIPADPYALEELEKVPEEEPEEIQQEEPKGYHWEDFTEEEAREEAERYYRELLEEKRAKEKSSAFEEQKHA